LTADATSISYDGNALFSTGTNTGTFATTGNVGGNNISVTRQISSNTIVATGLANVNSLSVQTSGSFANTVTAGNLTVSGNANFSNAYFSGNVTIPGNITQISGNSATFFGNATTGFGALYAGIPSGYANLPNAVLQVSTNFNGYTEVNQQNINGGAQASGDYVITSDVGTETSLYINMGMTSGTWDGTQPDSLGNALGPHDGYVYVDGGDMVLGTNTAGAYLKVNVGAANIAGLAATFFNPNTPAANNTSGTLVVVGGIGANGNIRGANVFTTGAVSAVGNVTGAYVIGDGSQLTNLPPGNYGNSNVAAYLPTYTGNLAALTGNVTTTANISANYLLGNGSQITGLPAGYANSDVQTYLASNANVTITTTGSISTTGNITGSYILGNGALLSGLVAGYSNTDAQGYLASNANVVITTTGNITTNANISGAYILGNGSQLTGLPANYGNTQVAAYLPTYSGNLVSLGGDVITTGNVSATGNVRGNNVVATNSITATNISVSGNVIATGQITVNSGANATAIINGAGNGVGNIGSSSNYFNTVYAVATSAQYADLAESYLADDEYASGTVLSIGGDNEVTLSTTDADALVAGVVSTKPAYRMNDGITGDYVAVIALVGRVPCLVQGPIARGAMLVSAGNGRARAEAGPAIGTVIGKALESFDGEFGTIEIVVGKL
jgi:hypothetical protein